MKTCPNPKCKTTGIPDEAQFCPVCGFNIDKYTHHQREYQKLLKTRQLWQNFKWDREHKFRVLERALANIRKERMKKDKKKKIVPWIRSIYYIILIGIIVTLSRLWGWSVTGCRAMVQALPFLMVGYSVPFDPIGRWLDVYGGGKISGRITIFYKDAFGLLLST